VDPPFPSIDDRLAEALARLGRAGRPTARVALERAWSVSAEAEEARIVAGDRIARLRQLGDRAARLLAAERPNSPNGSNRY
jgi:hypothetical protein